MTCNSIGSLAMERLDDWRRDVDQRVPAWPKSKIASEPPTAPESDLWQLYDSGSPNVCKPRVIVSNFQHAH